MRGAHTTLGTFVIGLPRATRYAGSWGSSLEKDMGSACKGRTFAGAMTGLSAATLQEALRREVMGLPVEHSGEGPFGLDAPGSQP